MYTGPSADEFGELWKKLEALKEIFPRQEFESNWKNLRDVFGESPITYIINSSFYGANTP